MKKKIALFLSVLLVLSVFAGCAAKPTATEPTKEVEAENTTKAEDATETTKQEEQEPEENFNETSTLNLAWFQHIGTDGMFAPPNGGWHSLYPDMIFDTLIKYDLGGEDFVGRLASDWSISEDGKTYTFTIRDNAKWHDGEPVTTDDVVFTFESLFKDPKAGNKSNYTAITGSNEVSKGEADDIAGISVNGNVVTLELDYANNALAHWLCRLVILPQHLLEEAGFENLSTYEKYWEKPIGSGPYKIDQVSFPNFFTAVVNEDWYGKQPAIKNVTFTSYEAGGAEAVGAALIAGQIDYFNYTEINDIALAQNVVDKNPDMEYKLIPSAYSRGLTINMTGSTDGKFNDDMKKKEVRQAINLLLDKEALASFYAGQAMALTTYIPSTSLEYNQDIPLFKRDVERARSLLEAADFNFDRPVRIMYYYNDQTTIDFMEFMKQNLEEGGVKVELEMITGDVTNIIYQGLNWDLLFGAGNPATFFENYKKMVPGTAADGPMGYIEEREEQFRPLWDGYFGASSFEEKKSFSDKMQVESLDQSMIIPIYGLNKVILYNKSKFYFDQEWNEGKEYAAVTGDWRFDEWKLLK